MYCIPLINILPWLMSPLKSFPIFLPTQYIKRGNYSNIRTFEITSLQIKEICTLKPMWTETKSTLIEKPNRSLL